MNQTLRQRHQIREVNTRREMRTGDRAPFTYAAACTPVAKKVDGAYLAVCIALALTDVALVVWAVVENLP